jgi:hypothetical protein
MDMRKLLLPTYVAMPHFMDLTKLISIIIRLLLKIYIILIITTHLRRNATFHGSHEINFNNYKTFTQNIYIILM